MAALDRPNILIICIDCLREDHVSGDAAQTPFLDELRSTGLEARDCHATATTTSPCVASLLTGTYSERNGVRSLDTGQLSDSVDTFAELFGDAGYQTEAFVTGPLVTETGLDRGFDAYHYREPERSLFTDWNDELQDHLRRISEPFGAYVHLWELHEDISVPAGFDKAEYGETPYARALSALDQRLESIVDAVPSETVVVVHGDHGESITHRHSVIRLGLKSFRDAIRYYGGIDTRSPVRTLNQTLADRGADIPDHYLENGHGENVFDFVTNVPLIIHGPGVDSNTVEAQIRQIDILPTLADLIDFDNSIDCDGESILPPQGLSDRPAYLRACGASLHRRKNWARAIRSDGWKLVTYPDRNWTPELYDLQNDPCELSPIDDPDQIEALRNHLPAEDALSGGKNLDVEDRLADLGYR